MERERDREQKIDIEMVSPRSLATGSVASWQVNHTAVDGAKIAG
jgi:hypothetical protein